MILPNIKRDVSDTVSDTKETVTSFANSFKSYDTCMANTGCKVIFIIGCVLAGLLLIWILTTLFQCLFMGAKCIEACCCCCCRGSGKQKTVIYENPTQTYANPNMQPPAYYERYAYAPQAPPMTAYPGANSRSDGYQPVAGYSHTSDPFADRNKA